MNKMVEDVKGWLETVGQTVDTDNKLQGLLYADLIEEEFGEFIAAHVRGDKVEELDAVADLCWVAIGYALSRGYDVASAWEEVRNSNYSKFDENGKAIKNPDTGKVMKGPNFFEPNLKPFVK